MFPRETLKIACLQILGMDIAFGKNNNKYSKWL